MRSRQTRRQFLGAAGALGVVVGLSASNFSLWAAADEKSKGIRLQNIRHVKIEHNEKTSCGPPRQCGIKNFGNGEIVLLYPRASSADKDMCRADMVLRRSRDNGETWPAESDVTVWSNATPLEKQIGFLCQDPAQRQVLDMSKPEAMFFFGRTPIVIRPVVKNTRQGWTCEWKPAAKPEADTVWRTVFQIRSVDRGHTWERVPLVLDPPPKAKSFWKDNHPLITMPNGALVGAFESEGALWLYGTESKGMTWQYLSLIAMEKIGVGKPCAAALIMLRSGRLQCYMTMNRNQSGALCLCESDDCFSWSEPRMILRDACDPWPLQLRDGRIAVIFTRLQAPEGIAVIVSEDEGKTWSQASMVREDACGPVAVQINDGRLFAAYQYPVRGEARFICGSFFELG